MDRVQLWYPEPGGEAGAGAEGRSRNPKRQSGSEDRSSNREPRPEPGRPWISQRNTGAGGRFDVRNRSREAVAGTGAFVGCSEHFPDDSAGSASPSGRGTPAPESVPARSSGSGGRALSSRDVPTTSRKTLPHQFRLSGLRPGRGIGFGRCSGLAGVLPAKGPGSCVKWPRTQVPTDLPE